MLFTPNGGETWEARSLPESHELITSLWFDQTGRGFASVWNGFVQQQGMPRMKATLYQTLDGGRTWQVALSGQKSIAKIFGLGPRQIWAVGDAPGFVPNDVVAIYDSPE